MAAGDLGRKFREIGSAKGWKGGELNQTEKYQGQEPLAPEKGGRGNR
ncbi:MAG: hypothetical protein HQL52_12975 [Magnetococcales bacterium]|nr:hypothetical protein [Magnetococcales bacterium]